MPLSLFRRTGILPNPNRLPVACGQAEHPLLTTGEPAARRSYVKNESVGACPQVTHIFIEFGHKNWYNIMSMLRHSHEHSASLLRRGLRAGKMRTDIAPDLRFRKAWPEDGGAMFSFPK